MELLEAVHAKHATDGPEIPGGLHQDIFLEQQPETEWAIAEDAGGTKQDASEGVGPVDQQVRFWVFGNNGQRVMQLARALSDTYDGSTLDLGNGQNAYGSVSTPPQFVTDPELMREVQVAFQVSFTCDFQM